MAVVKTSQNATEALQAAQAGLVDVENHLEANPYYLSPMNSENANQGYCSANGPSSNSNSFLLGKNVGTGEPGQLPRL